jgi:Fe-S cluster biosynthesis and repair protein YggX
MSQGETFSGPTQFGPVMIRRVVREEGGMQPGRASQSRDGMFCTIPGEMPTMPHMVFCARYKEELEGLDEPPFDSDFGNKVYNNVSKKAWQEWAERQKMLLNEYRLQPWTPQAQEFLVEQMEQFFFGEGAALPKEYVPPSH